MLPTRQMSENRRTLILFTRYPVPGRVKTRLIPALGDYGTVALHRRLVLRTLRAAEATRQTTGAELEICFDGGTEQAMRHWLGDGWVYRRQSDGDLGQRMARAFQDSLREGSCDTILIGSDCPELTPALLSEAFAALVNHPLVFGPATDGGHYLIGMSSAFPELFGGISWATKAVLAQSLRILSGAQVQPFLLDRRADIDRPEDLDLWERIVAQEASEWGRVSVIIPALNEEKHIAVALDSAQRAGPHEIIVVDGGSTDNTAQRAQDLGAIVIRSKRGRAHQMNAGAAWATGSVLLFLHADTLLPPHWPRLVTEALLQPSVAAGAFRLKIGEDFPGKRLVECSANFRSRWLRRPYGDQGLFLRRALFEEIGGFADLPIMEDYELVRRLRRRGRIVIVDEGIVTSGRRWRQLGFLRATLVNKLVIAGYHLGVAPQSLAMLYHPG
ncbi:MAG: TIGR04283 family arsenosugar biosynthesis glycosyltransferase [Verrucomicrobia bacterium]|nr:TIGR04283 family arsenosugar biosynthesis glycosyltransferase [Verrucomicrobiota bacterium]